MKIVVPIKSINNAKQRLAALLSNAERSQLMSHMIDDVLAAAQQSVQSSSSQISGVIVVTGDAQVARQAALYHARVLPEPNERSGVGDEALCAAVSMAANLLATEGEDSVLILPADVPLVTASSLTQLLLQHSKGRVLEQPAVTLVAARSDGGTNALLLSPPQVMPPMFGHNSCQRHTRWAQANNITPQLQSVPELALDIDTVADLQALMQQPLRSATQRYLVDSGIAEKIGHQPQNKTGRAVR